MRLSIFDIKEKLKRLREKFRNESPEAIDQITQWEKRVEQLALLDEFSSLDTTKAISQGIFNKIKELYKEKAFGKDHTNESLKILDARIGENKYLLGLFTPDFDSEFAQLMETVESELV